MKTRALFLSFILVFGLSLSSFASDDKDNKKSDDQQSQTTASDDQSKNQDAKEPKPKHDGGKDDVDAIGNRKLGGMDWYSIEKEVRMGKEYAQQIEQSMKMVQDPVVNEYVNRIGQNLVRNSDAKVPFTIKVVDSDALVIGTPERDALRAVQTPQAFDLAAILDAHRRAARAGLDGFPDDGALAEW